MRKWQQKFYKKFMIVGDVYKDKYEGWYCIGCESFKTESELADGHCPLHPPEKTVRQVEENWFFRTVKICSPTNRTDRK